MIKRICIIFISLFFVVLAQAKSKSERAKEFSEAGLNLLYFGDSLSAEKMYSQAVKLAPRNEYKVKYAQALILNGKYDEAEKTLSSIRVSGDLADAKNFFLGVILFKKGNMEDSKEKFTRLSQGGSSFANKSKRYLEKIKQLEKRYLLRAQAGLLYDSQVIDEDLVAGVGEEDGRLFLGSDLEYRYGKTSFGDLSFQGSVSGYYSFDDDHSLADPIRFAVAAPFRFETTEQGEDYWMSVAPGFETILLDVGNNGSRDLLYWAPTLRILGVQQGSDREPVNSYYAHLRWLSGEPSALENSTADIDGVSAKIGKRVQKNVNSAKNEYLVYDRHFEGMHADGDAISFVRAGGSVGYFYPFKSFQMGLITEARLSLYPDDTTNNSNGNRADFFFSMGTMAEKSLRALLGHPDWLQSDTMKIQFRGSFSFNNSNISSRDYERLLLGISVKEHWNF